MKNKQHQRIRSLEYKSIQTGQEEQEQQQPRSHLRLLPALVPVKSERARQDEDELRALIKSFQKRDSDASNTGVKSKDMDSHRLTNREEDLPPAA